MSTANPAKPASPPPIEAVTVHGFKTHRDRVDLALAPLTVLCGANSAGKTSAMQGLLLLKQTADSEVNRGALRLDGPLVSFDRFEEIGWRGGKGVAAATAQVTLGIGAAGSAFESTFVPTAEGGVGLQLTRIDAEISYASETMAVPPLSVTLTKQARIADFLTGVELASAAARSREPSGLGHVFHGQDPIPCLADRGLILPGSLDVVSAINAVNSAIGGVDPREVFGKTLEKLLSSRNETGSYPAIEMMALARLHWLAARYFDALAHVLYLPGHRGNPQRLYPYTVPTDGRARTPFSELFAGILLGWAQNGATGKERLAAVGEILGTMGMGWRLEAARQLASHIKLLVARTANQRAPARDLVSLPDVGFGVSQVLPVVVALVHAVPGQLVYIEQPEIHLHPKAQAALANAIVRAVRRGVRFVVETHSEPILLALQTAIARGGAGATDDAPGLDPTECIFHWFSRDEATGAAKVTTQVPDHAGRTGQWPVDFGTSMMDQQRTYVRAARDADRRAAETASNT